MKIYAAAAALMVLCACTQRDRFDLVKTEKGVIRIDHQTGGIVGVDEHFNARSIDLGFLGDELNTGAEYAAAKTFPTITLPGTAKPMKVAVQYRWRRGKIEYKVALLPYLSSLTQLNFEPFGSTNILTIILRDKDGFEVAAIHPPFWSGRTSGDETGALALEVDSNLPLSRDDFGRITSIGCTWQFSDAIKKSLSE